MNATLAIYDALIQANVSAQAAKAVVDALERDMTTWLATKQDFRHFEELITARMESLEARIDLKLHGLLIKLGILMTVLFSIAGGVAGLLR